MGAQKQAQICNWKSQKFKLPGSYREPASLHSRVAFFFFGGGAFWRPTGLTTFPQFQDSAGMGNNTETARVRACGFIRNLSGAVRVGGMGGGSWRRCCCVVSACTNQRPISNSKTRAQKASMHESTHERRKAEQHEAQAAQSTKA